MRLHRPFLLRSHRDPNYHFSQTASVSAAREILSSSAQVTQRLCRKSKSSRLWRFKANHNPAWFALTQHLAAVTILFIHALHFPDRAADFIEELRPSYEMFHVAARSNQPFIVRTAGNGDKVIESMIQVSHQKPLDSYPKLTCTRF